MSNIQTDNKTTSFSFRKGIHAPFVYKGHQIVVHNASFSPREKIWVDDELVVNRWSLSMDSTQVINVAGDDLILTYGWTSGMDAFFVIAKKGNEIVYEVTHSFRTHKQSNMGIILSMLAGGVIGFLSVQLIIGFF